MKSKILVGLIIVFIVGVLIVTFVTLNNESYPLTVPSSVPITDIGTGPIE